MAKLLLLATTLTSLIASVYAGETVSRLITTPAFSTGGPSPTRNNEPASFTISDVDEDEMDDEGAQKATLCIAPPCGLVAKAVSLDSLPVEWKLRIPPLA